MTADSRALGVRALERATRKSPDDFHRLVWSNWLRPWVRNRLAGPANAQVLAAYFDLQGEKSLAGGSYRFVFDDEGGRRALSARASSHWVELALARFASDPSFRAWADDCGYEVRAAETDLAALIERGPAFGFIELRKVLHGVPRVASPGDEPALFTDDQVKCTPFASLPKATQGRVMKVARGECACELCASVRVSVRAELAKQR